MSDMWDSASEKKNKAQYIIEAAVNDIQYESVYCNDIIVNNVRLKFLKTCRLLHIIFNLDSSTPFHPTRVLTPDLSFGRRLSTLMCKQ